MPSPRRFGSLALCLQARGKPSTPRTSGLGGGDVHVPPPAAQGVLSRQGIAALLLHPPAPESRQVPAAGREQVAGALQSPLPEQGRRLSLHLPRQSAFWRHGLFWSSWVLQWPPPGRGLLQVAVRAQVPAAGATQVPGLRQPRSDRQSRPASLLQTEQSESSAHAYTFGGAKLPHLPTQSASR